MQSRGCKGGGAKEGVQRRGCKGGGAKEGVQRMLPHGGPAQKASCGLYPHLASGAVGGRRGRKGCRKNGADLQARSV